MTTLYVDNIAPNLQSKISAPNLTLPTGSVVQVVSASFADQKTDVTSSGTFTNTHITADITPSSSSNKILALINTVVSVDATNTTFRYLRLGRDATTITATEKVIRSSYQSTSGSDVIDFSLHHLDSPSSTSSITYSLMADAAGQGMAVGGRMSNTGANGLSTITLMEIAG